MWEREWDAVPPELFTVDGGAHGRVQVANTKGFRVKASVVISASTLPDITLQVKRVISKTEMIVGPLGQSLTAKIDLSAYTIALGAFVYQNRQPKNNISPPDIIQAVYEQEPVCAIRTTAVDDFGNPYDDTNPMPIAFAGTIQIGDVSIVDQTTHDPVKVNPDGSLNVNVVPATGGSSEVKNLFGTAAAVVSGATTTIVQYTVPMNKVAILERSVASGENYGTFTVLVNNAPQAVMRNWYGDFNVSFEFITGQDNGLLLQPGDNVKVTILHTRPFVGNFDARIQVLELNP